MFWLLRWESCRSYRVGPAGNTKKKIVTQLVSTKEVITYPRTTSARLCPLTERANRLNLDCQPTSDGWVRACRLLDLKTPRSGINAFASDFFFFKALSPPNKDVYHLWISNLVDPPSRHGAKGVEGEIRRATNQSRINNTTRWTRLR